MFGTGTFSVPGLNDPRVIGALESGAACRAVSVRSGRRNATAGLDETIVAVRPTLALALQAYLDEVLDRCLPSSRICCRPPTTYAQPQTMWPPSKVSSPRAAGSIALLDTTAAPLRLAIAHVWRERAVGLGYEHVTFSSGWEPYPEEPGRGGGSAMKPTAPCMPGCHGRRVEGTTHGWSAAMALGWGRAPRWTFAPFV